MCDKDSKPVENLVGEVYGYKVYLSPIAKWQLRALFDTPEERRKALHLMIDAMGSRMVKKK